MTKMNSPESVANRVLQFVNEDERHITWLAQQMGVSHYSLRVVLEQRPELLTIDMLGKIANALNRPLTDLVVAA